MGVFATETTGYTQELLGLEMTNAKMMTAAQEAQVMTVQE
jgi:hypothetical protein